MHRAGCNSDILPNETVSRSKHRDSLRRNQPPRDRTSDRLFRSLFSLPSVRSLSLVPRFICLLPCRYWLRRVFRIFVARDIGPNGEPDSSRPRDTTEYYCHSCLPRQNKVKPEARAFHAKHVRTRIMGGGREGMTRKPHLLVLFLS